MSTNSYNKSDFGFNEEVVIKNNSKQEIREENEKQDVTSLPLDFSKEKFFPDNINDFKRIIFNPDFKFGFKLYSDKIVPLKHNDGLSNNAVNYTTDNVENLFNVLQTTKLSYIIINDYRFNFLIDRNINNGSIGSMSGLIETEKKDDRKKTLIENIKESTLKVLGFGIIKKEPKQFFDPYIIQYLSDKIKDSPQLIGVTTQISIVMDQDDKFIIILDLLPNKYSNVKFIKNWIKIEIYKQNIDEVIVL